MPILCGVSALLAYLPKVALVALAEMVRPCELRSSLIILRLAGTPLGGLNEKDPNALSSEPSGPPFGRI